MDGAGSGSALNTFGYYSGGSADVIVDTGRGIRFTSSASANFVNGHKWNFDFEEAGDYVINVSTSEHAARLYDEGDERDGRGEPEHGRPGVVDGKNDDQTGSCFFSPDQRGIGLQPDHERQHGGRTGEREQVPGTAADGCCDAGAGQPGPTGNAFTVPVVV